MLLISRLNCAWTKGLKFTKFIFIRDIFVFIELCYIKKCLICVYAAVTLLSHFFIY